MLLKLALGSYQLRLLFGQNLKAKFKSMLNVSNKNVNMKVSVILYFMCRLVPHVDDPDIYPNPHIIFKSGGGYSSPLGCKKYTANPITFGWNMKWGKIAHEVMHTLGKDLI